MLLRAALVPPAGAVEQLWVATRALRSVPGFTPVPQDRLDIPITAFGNLLPDDCARLARVLRLFVDRRRFRPEVALGSVASEHGSVPLRRSPGIR